MKSIQQTIPGIPPGKIRYSDCTHSPLRYPGGKQKLMPYLSRYFPCSFSEYRDPFFGGGSGYLNVYDTRSECYSFWVNDLNPELYHFWTQVKDNLVSLVKKVTEIKKYSDTLDCKRSLWEILFYNNGSRSTGCLDLSTLKSVDRAARFFVLNRASFSGLSEYSGYSKFSFENRFTYSSIERLANLDGCFNNVKITNLDYSDLLKYDTNEDVFVFLDPPYFYNKKSGVYGRKGKFHKHFDHELLSVLLKRCNYRWLMTCDDSPEIREMFDFANIETFEVKYSMRNVSSRFIRPSKEIVVSNYDFTF